MTMNYARLLAWVTVAGVCCGGMVLAAGDRLAPAEAHGIAVDACATARSEDGAVGMTMWQSGSSSDTATRSDACNGAQASARGNQGQCDADEELFVSACECVREEGAGLWSCEATWTCVPR